MTSLVPRPFLRLSLASLLVVGAGVAAASAQEDPSPDEVVATLEKISGVHQGLRRNHAKGACAVGTFQATPAAHELSASDLFSGRPVPVVGRFSLAGPNPEVPDTTKNPRGLALQFQLPGDRVHQMAMLNTPVFGASTVESFYLRQAADVPDPKTGQKDPKKLVAYLAAHPDSKAQADWLKTHNPPPSFARVAYHSLNAFKFTDTAKQERWVKWRFAPREGVAALTDAELQSFPKNFLIDEITRRAREHPPEWDMIVVLGEAGDPIDDSSVAWPAGRREVAAGTLRITAAGADAVGRCEDINFDPNLTSAGVDPSPDPILAFRSSAYAVSYGKRIEEKGR